MTFIEGNCDLGVTVTLELVSRLVDKFLANPIMVVKLAVDYSMDGIVGVMDRLATVWAQILNSQTAVAKSWWFRSVIPLRNISSQLNCRARTNAFVIADP